MGKRALILGWSLAAIAVWGLGLYTAAIGWVPGLERSQLPHRVHVCKAQRLRAEQQRAIQSSLDALARLQDANERLAASIDEIADVARDGE
jgi:hypothetical protein